MTVRAMAPLPAPFTQVYDVTTPIGTARLHVTPTTGRPRAVVVLGHGAGGGVEAPDLVALATYLPVYGYSVVRVEQPWRVAGGRVAPAPARLDCAWVPCVWAARDTVGSDAPVVVGGRSAGARVACRTASEVSAGAVVTLAFPLHPPGRKGVSRWDELQTGADGRPLLVVQGERDPFGAPAEFTGMTVATVPGADHSLRVGRRTDALVSQDETQVLVPDLIRTWWEGVHTNGNRIAP